MHCCSGGFLILSERFEWFAFNRHKGWTVLVCLAMVGAAFVLMFLWFLAALLFRLRFQFSLLTLLLLPVVVAISCGWLATEMKQARKQRERWKRLRRLVGRFLMIISSIFPTIPYQVSQQVPHRQGHPRIGTLLGDDLFVDVTYVGFLLNTKGGQYQYIANPNVSDAELQYVKGLTKLQWLYLGGTNVTDAGLEQLKGLAQLRRLNLDGPKISDAGLKYLKGLSRLQSLGLNSTKVSDAGLQHLKGLTHLQWLGLDDTDVTDAGLQHLKGLTHLQEIGLCGTKISDAGLQDLKGLTHLQWLGLSDTRVTDAGLQQLKALPHSKRFCSATPKSAMPGCNTLQN